MGILKDSLVKTSPVPKGSFLKYIGYGIAAVIVLSSSIYVVDPSEMANVRWMGRDVYTTPVGAGAHLKIPLIDTVDIVQVSLTTLHIPAFDVNTVDNQKITLEINFNSGR